MWREMKPFAHSAERVFVLVSAFCFLNKEVTFTGSKTTGLGQGITASLTGFCRVYG